MQLHQSWLNATKLIVFMQLNGLKPQTRQVSDRGREAVHMNEASASPDNQQAINPPRCDARISKIELYEYNFVFQTIWWNDTPNFIYSKTWPFLLRHSARAYLLWKFSPGEGFFPREWASHARPLTITLCRRANLQILLQHSEYFLIRAEKKHCARAKRAKCETSSHAESLSPVLEFAWAREINSVETLIFHFSSLSPCLEKVCATPIHFSTAFNTKLVRATGLATK
jgi:hypothetical protein